MKRIFIDTDIFVRDLRYPRDKNSESNKAFVSFIQRSKEKPVTSIFNVLELGGVLSFNFSESQLMRLYQDFPKQYNVRILFPADAAVNLKYDIVKMFKNIQKKQSLGDAQVAYVVEQFQNLISGFVSWNAKHFDGKLPVPVMTPKDFLKSH